ncbi:methyltransferase domain-containing protein [Geobacter argillaceus]|uniref:Methyltransferase family protein n=1 Tax=Geobacter argillaceus TaxID=345631 RepID=A0A562W7X5_9BACT|nr:methyltransferase domain-containing protein [Geobacter argillaceus]TWJ26350.1 methyltransferase family protein [Geobacter argillaceus]
MFFSELIKNIKSTDKVLEIGPGANPHPRADVLLEKVFENPTEKKEQRGNTPELNTSKKIIFYNGDKFPFKDYEFDYVICSHVLEHIDNVEYFISELFRVAKKGYVEYPTLYYEYLFNFEVHKNIFKYDAGGFLYYIKKIETPISCFQPVQSVFLEALNQGYSTFVDDLKAIMFEGFEWEHPFELKKTNYIEKLCFNNPIIKKNTFKLSYLRKIKYLLDKLSTDKFVRK